MRRLTPLQIAVLVVLALGALLAAYVLVGSQRGAGDDRLRENQGAAAAGRPSVPGADCAAQRTYDELRRELFRKAAALRGRDEAAFDRIARNAMLTVDRPRLLSNDQAIGQQRCAGTLTVALPPGLATGSGQSRLSGEAEYAVQPAADGSGPAVTVIGGDSLTAALATLVRSGGPTASPAAPPASPPLAPTPSVPVPVPAPPGGPMAPPAPPPTAHSLAARPSFDCRRAQTRSERAVCSSEELAALDRRMAAQFGRAMAVAGPGERVMLQRTRLRFLTYREGCGTDRCIADAYRGRMAEIADIVSGRWQVPR